MAVFVKDEQLSAQEAEELLVRLAVPVNLAWIRTPLSVFQEIPVGRWMKMGELLTEKRGYGELFALLGGIYLWGVVLLAAVCGIRPAE